METDGSPVVERLSLRRNFYWALVGNVVYSGCQWGMLVVLAKLTSPEVVGRFALGYAVTAPVVMFANLQLRSVQATDAREDYRFGHYFALRLVMAALAILVIMAVVYFSNYKREATMVILAVGVAKTVESISDVFHGLAQHHERMDRIAVSLVIRGPLSLAALGLVTYATGSIFWGTVAMALTWAIVLMSYDLATGRMLADRQCEARMKPLWDRDRLVSLTLLSLPLGLTMLLVSLNVNMPRYFIERYLGEAELGVFAAMAYLMVAGSTVVGALGHSATPRLAQYYADADRVRFVGLLWKLTGMGALTGLVGVLVAAFAGQWLLTVLYGPEYALQTSVFVWVAVAAGIIYVQSFIACGVMAARHFRVQVLVFGSATAATTATCVWLVPDWGLAGAAAAVVIGSLVMTIATLAAVIHAVRNLKRF